MREIKFRAWFTRDEKYIKPMTIQNMIHQNVSTFSLSVLYNEVVFEQYTGLKDFNGVEIYEGDIVTIPLNEAAYSNNTIAVVSYDENSMLLAGSLVLSRIYTAVEVIGNVHQNSDLLVDDTDRISPDDIGNDIHEFLHGGDK